MARRRKNRMITMRITEDQFQYIEELMRRIKEQTGFRITRASVLMRIIHFGIPQLEREFPKNQNPTKVTENTG